MKTLRYYLTILLATVVCSIANAANIAVLNVTSGSSNIETNLTNAGHTVTQVTQADVTGGALAGYDAFIMGRNWSSDNHDVAYRDAVVTFVNNGGGLITEWDNYAFLFDGYEATFRYDDTLPQGQFITGDVGAGQSFPSTFTIDNAMAHPIWGPLPASLTVSGIEFPYTTYNANLTGWDVVATFDGDGSTNFPAQTFPAIIASQTLPVVGMAFDWGDAANDPDVIGLYTRAVDYVLGITVAPPTPVPATSTWSIMLMLFGLLALAGYHIRRQQSS